MIMIGMSDGSVLFTYDEILCSDDKDKWLQAINDEKDSLIKNNTWKYVDLDEAKGKNVLDTKWVF